MATTTTYVVVFDYQHADVRRFWSGTRWVVEYPDAETYATEGTGVTALRRAEARANLRDNEACLVRDYGLDTWSKGK